jgi:uncharacterized membrane protein YccC
MREGASNLSVKKSKTNAQSSDTTVSSSLKPSVVQSLLAWCRDRDPGLIALRRATRAAVIMPVIFFVTDTFIGDPTFALFASFGSLATLLLVSFAGSKHDHLIEAGTMILIQLIFVCLGTIVSRVVWLAVLLTFVITFSVFFVSILKPSFSKITTPLLVSFLLPSTIPAPFQAVPDRFLGWAFASIISLLGIVYLWPVTHRDPVNEVSLTHLRRTIRTVRNEARRKPGVYVERQRHAVRAAIALGLAVLIAHLFSAQHAFWVVLGALNVLCSNAINTGQKVESALLGTVIGIIVASGLITLIGTNIVICWVLLPLVILYAGFASVGFSFMAGQIGFTTLLLLLSDITTPIGWRLGIVRLEDIALGCLVSLFVGLVFWPRGTMMQPRKTALAS